MEEFKHKVSYGGVRCGEVLLLLLLLLCSDFVLMFQQGLLFVTLLCGVVLTFVYLSLSFDSLHPSV